MKSRIISITLINLFALVLSSNIFGQDNKSTPSPFATPQLIDVPSRPPQKISKKCSPIIEGFQYCTTTPTISVILGESVAVDIVIQNMTEKNLSIIHGKFFDYYKANVKDAMGNEIPTLKEFLYKKFQDKTITPEEFSELQSIEEDSKPPRKIILSPQQTYKVQFSLGYFYNFKTKGKYYIEMRRLIPAQNGEGKIELSFGTIEIDIK